MDERVGHSAIVEGAIAVLWVVSSRAQSAQPEPGSPALPLSAALQSTLLTFVPRDLMLPALSARKTELTMSAYLKPITSSRKPFPLLCALIAFCGILITVPNPLSYNWVDWAVSSSSVVDWIRNGHNTWSMHTTEYYSALKRKGILTRATTWMNLEDIVLSEISQSQKDKYCVVPIIRGT